MGLKHVSDITYLIFRLIFWRKFMFLWFWNIFVIFSIFLNNLSTQNPDKMLTRNFFTFFVIPKNKKKRSRIAANFQAKKIMLILPFEFFDVRSGSFKSNTKHSLLLLWFSTWCLPIDDNQELERKLKTCLRLWRIESFHPAVLLRKNGNILSIFRRISPNRNRLFGDA